MALQEAVVKQRMATRFNTKVIPKKFEVGDLVLKRDDVGLKNVNQGKLAPNLEGPYRVSSKTVKGAYILETLSKTPISRTWNVTELWKYYS